MRGHFRDAGAEKFGGAQIGVGRCHIGAFIRVRLRGGAKKETVPVQRVFRRLRMIVSRWKAEVDPVHPVLRRENRDLLQRGQLVAGARSRIGEAGCDLVGPVAPLREDTPGSGIHELLELRGRAPHIGGRAEDDSIHVFERAPMRIDVLDADEKTLDSFDTGRTACHRFCDLPCMAIAAVVDDRDTGSFKTFRHDLLHVGRHSR